MFSIDSERHLPLGIDGDEEYETATVDLQIGDQIIVYTDGVTEAFNRQFEMFGLERLDRVLEDCRIDASGLIAAVLEALDAFTDGNKPNDDRTIIVARITP
jgi:sigma-B regulation protein RsbU (phosphoserine phosphatase)